MVNECWVNKLIIYEFTGVLIENSGCIVDLRKYITKTLVLYFGTEAIQHFPLESLIRI